MQKKYADDVAFLIVYVREAHPSNGRQIGSNRKSGVVFTQPKTFGQREKIAHAMCEKLDISIPCLIDNLDNKVGLAYAGMPDRLYVVGIGGKIIYKGGPGPFGFKPAEVDEALKKYLPTIKKTPAAN